MTAEAIGRAMPPIVTLDDLAAMNDADQYGHRYELSPEGALSIMPPPGSEHAVIASRLFAWLLKAGWPAEQLLQAVGIRIPGPEGDGGRIPDLTVWAKPPTGVWVSLTDLVVAIEIVSPSSKAIDEVVKRQEYAQAGIPQYWVVDRDPAQTVTMYELGPETYVERAKLPLAWLLNTSPADHLG